MFKRLILLLVCLSAFSSAQTCGDSSVPNMQSGLIELGVPTASFAQKDYIYTFKSNLGAYSTVFSAFAIAGFQGSCTQQYYSLVVDQVTYENNNTRMRVTMDYTYTINLTNNYVSQWTKVKLTFIVVTTQFSSYAATEKGNFVWAGSSQVNVNTTGVVGIYGLGSIFDNSITAPDVTSACGYLSGLLNSNSPKFDMICPAVDKIIPHYYIMGFRFAPSATYTLAASATIPNYLSATGTLQSAQFGTNQAQGFGPLMQVSQYGGALQKIKIGIVLTTLRGFAAYPNNIQIFTYSGVYMPVSLKNSQVPIVKGGVNQYNMQNYNIPKLTYQIYGLSSFTIANVSTCSFIDIDVSVANLYSLQVSTGNTDTLGDIFVSADFFTKNTFNLCSGSTSPARQMVEITQKSANTVPDMIDQQQNIQQTSNTPSLVWRLKGRQTINGSLLINYNIGLAYQNFTVGNAYKFTTSILKGDTTFLAALTGVPTPYVRYTILVNSQVVYDTYLNTTALLTDGLTYTFGLAIGTATPNISFVVAVPRPTGLNLQFTADVSLRIDEYTTVYNAASDCCTSKCPTGSQINFASSPPSCINCQGDNTLVFNPISNNCQCKIGYYNILSTTATGQIVCFPCIASLCSTCTADSLNTCTTCVVGATFDSNNTCKCNPGFYQANGTCTACPAKCSNCSTGGVCNTCADRVNRIFSQNCACVAGFYDDGSSLCKACNPLCLTCTNSSSCSSCVTSNNRTLVNGQCVCASRFYQYINTDNSLSCVPCGPECQQCSGPNTCLNCNPSDNRIFGYDSAGHQTCLCASGYYSLSITGSCVQTGCKADPFCQTCDLSRGISVCIQCLSSTNRVLAIPSYACVCADGFYQSNGVCVPCSSGCATCSSATVCTNCVAYSSPSNNGTCACPSSYYFEVTPLRYCNRCNTYCLSCNNSASCNQCLPGFLATTNGACICPRGNYVNSNLQCLTCVGNCSVCSAVNNCSLCNAGSYLQNNVCVQRCNQGFYISGAACQKCQPGCTFCDSAAVCLVCDSGKYSYNGLCYINCPNGTVADVNATTLSCVACNSPCSNCVQHPSKCTTCSVGNYYSFGCVTNCPTGTFNNNGICTFCSFSCASCLGTATTCISCPTGQFLFAGTCNAKCPVALVNGLCPNVCPTGYYTDANSNCVKCSTGCATCSNSASNCTSCSSGVASNGVCISSCPTNTVNINGNCLACAVGCNGCSVSISQCLNCQSGYFLSANKCISACPPSSFRDSSNNCINCPSTCLTCTTATYCTSCLDARSQPVNGVCYSCSYPCTTCSDYNTCTGCLSGFSLSNSQCVGTCPRGSSNVNGNCVCSTGIIQSGACVSSCSLGFTNINGVCQACSSKCLTCSNNINICTSCPTGYDLDAVSGICQVSTNCQYGQYFSSDTKLCTRICPAGTSFQDSVCLAGCLQGFVDNGFGGCISRIGVSGCSYPYFYLQASCVSVCSPGTFPDSSTRVCGACSSNCFSCMSSAFCTACSSGFDLSNGICVAGKQCSNNQFKYNGVCLSACPVGTISSNGYCQRRCGTGLYFLNGKCYDICPSTVAFRTDAACVSSCPTGYVLNGTVCKLSAQNCPIGQFYSSSSNTCASCSSSCLQCQYTSNYCISCPTGQTLSGSTCVNALNPCGSGKCQTSTGQCATCSAKCAQCISPNICSTCANSYVFNGYDCVLQTVSLKEVKLTQSAISRSNSTVYISVKLTLIPNGLTSVQQNQFFIVIPSSADSIVLINQWLSPTDSTTVIVAVQYATYPKLSTVFLALNAQILSSSYANIGYTATENSYIPVIVSNSVTDAPSNMVAPPLVTNSVAGTIDNIPAASKSIKYAIQQANILV